MTVYRINDLVPRYVVKQRIAIRIVNHFLSELIRYILDGHTVGLPQELGYLRIVSKDVPLDLDGKNNVVNWKATKELWESNPEAKENKTRIFYLNEHTGLKYYKYHWTLKNSKWPMKTFYCLKPSKVIKKKLYNAVISGKEYEQKS